jgi:hypothetical protein
MIAGLRISGAVSQAMASAIQLERLEDTIPHIDRSPLPTYKHTSLT